MSKEKESIINGIDVSECCCFENDRCLWSKRYYENCYVVPPCEAVKDCYFKQLKRLQEENEKLKNKNNDLIEEIASGNIDIAILQKENEDLKNRLKILDEEEFVYEVTEIEYNNFKKMNKYKQALEEIQKILYECGCAKLNDIRLIINEVLNDRD